MREISTSKQKKRYVQEMFNSIAYRYDFLNHLLSFGIDIYWRKAAIKQLGMNNTSRILDLATGTGDLALEAVHQHCRKVVGVDVAFEMLRLGVVKVRKRHEENRINFVCGDGERLPVKSAQFDGTMIAFGIRNMSDIGETIKEMYRILKPHGRIILLEFSNPKNPLFKRLYYLYFKHILPGIGAFFSKNKNAYEYLPDSVMNFPSQTHLLGLMKNAGFSETKYKDLTFGVVTSYSGVKKEWIDYG